MALPTNTITTYSSVGNREDLSDMIYRIDPTDTPFMSGAEKEKATAVNHEWQTQALAPASTANAQLEGDDPSANALVPTVRLGNLCQISYKMAQVSGTQQAVDHAGRDNELAYQEMLKGLELKRDIESILVGTNQAKVAGSTSTPRRTASILSWIASNTSKGTAGSPADPAAVDGTGMDAGVGCECSTVTSRNTSSWTRRCNDGRHNLPRWLRIRFRNLCAGGGLPGMLRWAMLERGNTQLRMVSGRRSKNSRLLISSTED